MMKIRGINAIQKEIVKSLYDEETPLTMSEMSQKIGRDKAIIEKHAHCLREKGIINIIPLP